MKISFKRLAFFFCSIAICILSQNAVLGQTPEKFTIRFVDSYFENGFTDMLEYAGRYPSENLTPS